jgi:hypothetical protein
MSDEANTENFYRAVPNWNVNTSRRSLRLGGGQDFLVGGLGDEEIYRMLE